MDKLTASEALYGFCGWITTRKERVCASEKDEAGVWAELIDEFCKKQGLEPPRENLTDLLVSMKKGELG